MKPCTENPAWGFNQAAKDAPVIVQVIYCLDPKKTTTLHVKGMPMVAMHACEGGSNWTITCFVPDEDDK